MYLTESTSTARQQSILQAASLEIGKKRELKLSDSYQSSCIRHTIPAAKSTAGRNVKDDSDGDMKEALISLLAAVIPESMPVGKVLVMADLLMTAQSLNEIEDIILALHSEIPTTTIVARVSKITNITHREEPDHRPSNTNMFPPYRAPSTRELVLHFLVKALQ